MTYQARNFDWAQAWRKGEDLATEQVRRGDPIDARAIMWALLCEAAKTSSLAFQNLPRSSWPQKSALPDAPADISQWALIGAYLRGELDEMPTDESRPPQPDASTITRAENILWLWHHTALTDQGDRKRMRKAVYLKASGVPDRKVRAVTGFTRERIKASRRRAMDDMIGHLRGLTQNPIFG